MIDYRVSLNLQRVMCFDLNIARELQQAFVSVVERAIGNDLIRFISRGRKYLKIHLLEFMMPVLVSHIARRAQPKIQAVLFSDPLFVTVENGFRSEEHTSELQSRVDLVCR